MAWQPETGASSDRATDYRDLLTKIVGCATSQHAATVAVNAGGSGYVVGDVLTLTHAGALLDARFEVTTVSTGAVTGLRIVASGAFSNRVATVAVNAGGTGYAVGDIVEIQGGTAREKAKARVTTVSSGVVTGVALFETGGSYSVAPGLTGATTVGVGPAAFAGDDALTLDITMTGLVGTTGLSVTGGTGASATVDIALDDTGWAVDSRNTNGLTVNGLTDEKEVVLVGDATGRTNKPLLGFQTGTVTNGLNDRYFIALFGMVAHNPATALSTQAGISPGTPGTFADGGSYLLCDENQNQEMDFWFAMDDLHMTLVTNLNPGAGATDSGEYMQAYAGFIDSFATETEDPYPLVIGAPSRVVDVDPSAVNIDITGLSECKSSVSDSSPVRFYSTEAGSWVSVQNSLNNSGTQSRDTVMLPIAEITLITNAADFAYQIVQDPPVLWTNGIGLTTRGSATARLLAVPGSSALHFPFPLTIASRPGGTSVDTNLDTLRGQLRGVFWVSATDTAGATIANFSEDYFEVSGDRYRVFHTHVHTQLYHYIAVKEAV